MPKHSKHQTAVLRKLQHEACVLRDKKCCKCGRTQKLQASHVYPKGTHRSMEYDLDNVKTLCYCCHIHWWHKNPIESATWFNEKYPDRAKRLKLMSQTSHGVPDYNLIKLYLEQEIKKYAISR